MDQLGLKQVYSYHPHLKTMVGSFQKGPSLKLYLKGLAGSSKSLVCASAFNQINKPFLVILNDKEEAAFFFNDLLQMCDENEIFFFPSSYKRSAQFGQTDPANIIQRTEILNKIHPEGGKICIVTYPEALAEQVITKSRLKDNTLELKTGENISLDFLKEVLHAYGFTLVDFVYGPGQYSVRGSIVDVFSYSSEYPYRIDFFGDEVDSIRTFDIENQLSKQKLPRVSILPDTLKLTVSGQHTSFLDFIPTSSVIWSYDLPFISQRINDIYVNVENRKKKNETPEEIYADHTLLITGHHFLTSLTPFHVVEFGHNTHFQPDETYEFHIVPQPRLNKNFQLLVEQLKQNQEKGIQNYILSEQEKQHERLENICSNLDESLVYSPLQIILHEGFTDLDLNISVYTDHQIFDRYHKFRLKDKFLKKESISIKELNNLHPGDYVVHIDHGIGIFGGLEAIEINGKKQESIKLVYKDNDILYISIHSLHRISKYKGKDTAPPKVYKLGTGAWQKLKQKTKSKIKDIAKDLIALYAKRKMEKGFAFSADSFLQHELEASFIYEDTPDQLKATREVKEDMESLVPMDRLICGDVGFGKTEVAIRAAFKAVTDNKQVAVLVPTTILALQHYTTFKERLKNFPCTVEYISRLKKAPEIKKNLERLQKGEVEILIGTHRLIGKDVTFKDLGLLIIDEEQKFGVGVKEKLKQLKTHVDTLTMTATPIPRTLQFSLMGARDLSIIHTPPPNRQPIITEIHTFDEEIIREAILYEVSRNGQVFFIHNRIQNIHEVEALINRLCPKVKTVVAHGQMEGKQLESIMLDFIDGQYDVLIATTIIESGLDIPNANTMIINNANNFGLSDLHQLRGRVGRSNKKAFAYLLAPPMHMVTAEARRRLQAIEEFSDLGSGFNIAMQDLDIRGAGNLLGSEQSGFITDIGFEAYNRILTEAMQELKEEEFKDLFATTKDQETKEELEEKWTYVTDCQIDTDLELLFPEEYISNISERIHLYRVLDNVTQEEELTEFSKQLTDRFGKLPEQTTELLNVVRLRWKAIDLGFEKIILKNGKMIIHFISNQESPYYQSGLFLRIITFIQKNPGLFKMKESEKRLSLLVEKIKNVYQALEVLSKFNGE